ncbi:chemotaxis response regulator protein-glutamate methylesterase [Haloarcula mannanilytica]|uniref:Protein-glutamate methylesterase/protein-glutamine glutaminase n=1 Tax=Haloarcula mannanilytica TaxID=2509225 RepID=A0A4C2ENF1_9EURY|nr:chemotaxis response regulator protein-glutamate methylesterase [Haloarcula mannanilytica]GCF14123.1 chemotaxis response regulator protein-glutamate methylesterase [Haloarcula mannanilytica]
MADGVRAVVADDSHFMRSVISDILSDGGIDVVAQARDGEEAVSAVIEHEPDVVTMDVEMPVMNGIEATERIMAECPTPVLMLSAHTDENADVTFEALDKGAVDFFTKPGGEVSMEMSRLKDQLVEIVVSVAAVDVGTTKGSTTSSGGTASTAAGGSTTDRTGAGTAASQTTYVANPTLVIGSSTGGPKMVEQVMEGLPIEADLRVLIIQHMPEGFTGRFAERINTRSEYEVREATDGARIGGGEGLVAAGDQHMVVKNYRNGRLRTKLTQDAPVNSVRPAVDVTMRTAAETIDDPLVGLILTGMGEDGADGIRRIKQAGGETIAQDEATSAVYGMPKRAVETGCVDTVLPIGDIADGIIDTITTEVT